MSPPRPARARRLQLRQPMPTASEWESPATVRTTSVTMHQVIVVDGTPTDELGAVVDPEPSGDPELSSDEELDMVTPALRAEA